MAVLSGNISYFGSKAALCLGLSAHVLQPLFMLNISILFFPNEVTFAARYLWSYSFQSDLVKATTTSLLGVNYLDLICF